MRSVIRVNSLPLRVYEGHFEWHSSAFSRINNWYRYGYRAFDIPVSVVWLWWVGGRKLFVIRVSSVSATQIFANTQHEHVREKPEYFCREYVLYLHLHIYLY